MPEIDDIAPIPRHSRFGPELESFVFGERLKFCAWSERRHAMSCSRDKSQREADFFIEDAQGGVIGIETKSAAPIGGSDFAGLRQLATLTGARFMAGLARYDGDLTLPFGPGLWAALRGTPWQARFSTERKIGAGGTA